MTTNEQLLRITPFGGLGQVGMNCMALEYGDNILVIDVGLMFPEDDMHGVDLVIPDLSQLIAQRDRIRAIVLTHGHEDHVGALPYLLEQVSAPVYATPLTRGLVETKRRGRGAGATLNAFRPGEEISAGPFRVTPFHVNHSIPDAVGLAIRTPIGLVVHSGDFKVDHTPLEGRTTDLGALAQLAHEGVLLLMADSTNAESPGYTASESQLIDTFRRAFARAQGRIVVTTFASLLSRVQLAIETAAAYGRKVAVAGRSMEENVAIAEELGYVRFPPNTRVPLAQIGSLPDHEVCVLATGSQGEPNAALARMAAGRFRHVNIREGDTVLLSSKPIPGNETQVHRNIDNLFRRGATVIYGEEAGLHVSGHAAQEELKLLLNLLRPRHFMPIHGAFRMLHQHARLAYELGIPRQDVFVIENGQSLEIDPEGARLGQKRDLETVFVDGALVGDVGKVLLRDRKALGQDGFVVARVSLASGDHDAIEDVEIVSHGFVYIPESGALLQAAEELITETVARNNGNGLEALEQRIRRRLEDLFYEQTRRRPIVIPMVNDA